MHHIRPLAGAIRAATFGLLIGGGLLSPALHAQSAAQQTHQYTVPAGPLGIALAEFASQAGITVSIEPDQVEGLRSRGLKGATNVDDGLQQLLEGSGLEAVRATDGSFTLRKLPAGETTLRAVKVQAAGFDAATTEGSGSYAAKAVTVGRVAQSLREIPQSVTVMTRQLIEDQNLQTIDDLMIQAPGIVVERDGSGYTGFWSRGFQIDNYQIDGVPIAYESIFRPNQDMALYDRVEVLRGADGLFSGTGEAGGTINLVRKRPLDAQQVLFAASAGRWNNYRGEIDVSSPLAFDGKLKGRAVAVYQNRDFFYSPSDEEKTLYYGIVSLDIAPRTVLSVSASRQHSEGVLWRSGLPRYSDGGSIGLSRGKALTLDWAARDNTTTEYFVDLEHAFNDDWSVRLSAARQEYETDDYMASVNGPVDIATGALGSMSGSYEETGNKAEAINIHLAGHFELFGLRHSTVIGADWQESTAKQMRFNLIRPTYSPGSVFDFDSGDTARPSVVNPSYGWPAYGAQQDGVYAKLQMHLLDTLQFVVGGRYSNYDYSSPTVDYDFPEDSSEDSYGESGIFTPYGGLIYDFSAHWTAYLSVAEIHKSQSNYRKGPPPGTALEAITGRSVETGIKGELLDGRFNTALALYRIERDGEQVSDPSYPYVPDGRGSSCCYLARGEVVSEGIDAEIAGELAPGWQAMLSYTYNRNEDKSSDTEYHAAMPRHLFKAWTSYRLPGSWSAFDIGGGVTAQSKAANAGLVWVNLGGSLGWGQVPYRVEQGGYSVWQARAGYRIDEHWSLALNLNNVFDKVYYQSVGNNSFGNWYGEPRSYTLSVRGQF